MTKNKAAAKTGPDLLDTLHEHLDEYNVSEIDLQVLADAIIETRKTPGGGGGVDNLTEMCAHAGLEIDPTDGLMLLVFPRDGSLRTHIFRLGMMSAGRLEQRVMMLYHAIDRERMRVNERTRLSVREETE